jgi:hypothetical protein
MKFSDFVQSKYLSKADVEKPTMFTIGGYSQVEVEPGKMKIAVKFREHDKPMLLNKTNTKRLQNAFGNDSAVSVGKKVAVYVDDDVTDMKGNIVGGLRLKVSRQDVENESQIPF